MITVYVHIGASKTGTSAIQAFLNYQREILIKDYSCLYPNFSKNAAIDKGNNGHNHCNSVFKSDKLTFIENLEKSVNFCRENGITKIIISCEALFQMPDFTEDVFSRFQNIPDLTIRIIFFIRRQDHFVESSWKQWGSKNSEYLSIDEYIEKRDVPWLYYLNKYKKAFGKENIVVYPYEKEQLPDGLIPKFLQIVGIQYSGNNWILPPETNLNINSGFNRDIIEILALNKQFVKNVNDNALLDFFSGVLPECYKKKPYDSYAILSPKQRITILKKYEKMNENIARQYLGRKDGRLFFEPWPDPDEPWEPYEGLTVEKIVPIFTQMMLQMEKNHKHELTLIKKEMLRLREKEKGNNEKT